MKKIILILMLLVNLVLVAVPIDYVKDMNRVGARNGQMFKNDGTVINEADLLDTRNSLDTVFGDKITGIRKNSVAAQFQYGLNTDNVTMNEVNGGTVTIEDAMLTVQTSTATTGSACVKSKQVVRYIPGQESYMYFTAVYSEGKKNSYQRVGLFDENDGFFVGYEGEQFGVSRRRDGTDYFTTISSLNLDVDFELDPQKGNIYRISYGYLGFATINFEVLKPQGNWALLHRIQYPNSHTQTHITNTYLPVRSAAGNTGNDTNIKIQGGSVAAGIVDGGGVDVTSRSFSYADTIIDQPTNVNSIVIFRNKTTFNSLENKIPAQLIRINSANDGNKPVLYKLIKDPAITNTPTWNDVNDNSTLEYSTDAAIDFSSVTATDILTSWVESSGGNTFETVERANLLLYPGEIAVFYTDTSSTAFDLVFGIRWKELF